MVRDLDHRPLETSKHKLGDPLASLDIDRSSLQAVTQPNGQLFRRSFEVCRVQRRRRIHQQYFDRTTITRIDRTRSVHDGQALFD